MINRVIFFNTWHFGDLHSNKEYVRHFLNEFNRHGIETIYATAVAGRAVNLPVAVHNVYDYPHLVGNPVSYFDQSSQTMYINTWIGHYLAMQSHNFSSQKAMWEDISQRVVGASDGQIVISLYDHPMDYVSQIDEELIGQVTVPEGKKIIFCNDAPISGQSFNGDWAEAINRLASQFPDITFICTRQIDMHHENIMCTNQLTNRDQIICDLPEIGYISERCDIIITNSSGPGTFVMTRNNFQDSNKSIIAFVIGEGNTFWNGIDGVKADTSWYPFFDDDNVYIIVREKIVEKILNHSG